MDFTKIAEINLIGGAGGGDPRNGLCIMEMVSWFDGAQKVTDRPECACPFLTDVALRLNDRAPTQEDRNTLKPLLPLLAGTRDEPSRRARAWFVMRESVLRILCVPLEKIGKTDLAESLRAADSPKALNDAVHAARSAMKANAAYANADAYAPNGAMARGVNCGAGNGPRGGRTARLKVN